MAMTAAGHEQSGLDALFHAVELVVNSSPAIPSLSRSTSVASTAPSADDADSQGGDSETGQQFSEEILSMGIRDLNRFLKGTNYTAKDIRDLKLARRRRLNRKYAQVSRRRRRVSGSGLQRSVSVPTDQEEDEDDDDELGDDDSSPDAATLAGAEVGATMAAKRPMYAGPGQQTATAAAARRRKWAARCLWRRRRRRTSRRPRQPLRCARPCRQPTWQRCLASRQPVTAASPAAIARCPSRVWWVDWR